MAGGRTPKESHTQKPWTVARESNPPATSTQPGRAEVVDQINKQPRSVRCTETAAGRASMRAARLAGAAPIGSSFREAAVPVPTSPWSVAGAVPTRDVCGCTSIGSWRSEDPAVPADRPVRVDGPLAVARGAGVDHLCIDRTHCLVRHRAGRLRRSRAIGSKKPQVATVAEWFVCCNLRSTREFLVNALIVEADDQGVDHLSVIRPSDGPSRCGLKRHTAARCEPQDAAAAAAAQLLSVPS